MKTTEFLEECLSLDRKRALVLVATSDTENFNSLTKIANLDPSQDFRYCNLQDVDFSGCDLSGHDFTGADLRGCTGVGVRYDHTTKFSGARVDTSIFAHAVRLSRFFDGEPRWRRRVEILKQSHWTETPLWLDENLDANNKDRDAAVMVAQALFDSTYDAMIRTEILYRSGHVHQTKEAYRDFVIHALAIGQTDSVEFLKSGLSLVARLFCNDYVGSKILEQHVNHPDKEVRTIAIAGVVRSEFDAARRIELLREILAHENSAWVRRSTVGSIARSAGSVYLAAVRYPEFGSGERFIDCADVITWGLLEKIAFRQLSAESVQRQIGMRFTSYREVNLDAKSSRIKQRSQKILELLLELKECGVPFKFQSDIVGFERDLNNTLTKSKVA